MFITTLANSFIYCVSRSFIYTGPLIWISIVFGSIVDIFYGALTKPFVNSQKQVDKMIHESISSKSSQKQVAIVTGGNSGIGYATAKAIGRAGYHTILACRNQSLGEKAVANLVRETGQTNFELMILDLASFESVHKFVKQFKSKYQQLNLLVNNAGVVKANHMLTADGVEMQFGTNYLGPFLLTTELLDIMKQTGSARIVNVSSLGSYFNSHMDTKLVEDTRHYNALRVYYNSKLAITMFSAALARKLQGTGIT
ncbi:Retinol dehydrogenase 13, partial [Linderina macrospora]